MANIFCLTILSILLFPTLLLANTPSTAAVTLCNGIFEYSKLPAERKLGPRVVPGGNVECWANDPQYGPYSVYNLGFDNLCPIGETLVPNSDPAACTGTPPVPCPVGPIPGGNGTYSGTGGGSTGCAGGCSIECVGICVGLPKAPEGGATYGDWKSTGVSCSTTTGAKASDCPKGQVRGTFNGASLCLPGGPPGSAKTESTKTNTKTNPDGSTTTTNTNTTTSCTVAGSCTNTTNTTTNTYAPGADPGTATPTSTSLDKKTDTQDKQAFCDENPNATVCKETSFSASCGVYPTCTGDAVQCATAKATFETNCTLNPAANSLSDLGNSVATGTENLTGAIRSSEADREIVDIQSSLDTSKFLPSGCPPDRLISLPKGQTLTLPFSRLCGVLQFMGSIVIAFSMLGASRIVGVV